MHKYIWIMMDKSVCILAVVFLDNSIRGHDFHRRSFELLELHHSIIVRSRYELVKLKKLSFLVRI